MARPAFFVCGRVRDFGTAQYPRALRRHRDAVCRAGAGAANARNGGGLRSKINCNRLPLPATRLVQAPVSRRAQRGGYAIRTARVLSSRRTWPTRKESIIFGSPIFFPSSWTLPCLIKRLASARDFAIAKA